MTKFKVAVLKNAVQSRPIVKTGINWCIIRIFICSCFSVLFLCYYYALPLYKYRVYGKNGGFFLLFSRYLLALISPIIIPVAPSPIHVHLGWKFVYHCFISFTNTSFGLNVSWACHTQCCVAWGGAKVHVSWRFSVLIHCTKEKVQAKLATFQVSRISLLSSGQRFSYFSYYE